jgi:hypothetical protein
MSLYASISKQIRKHLNKDDKNSAFKLALEEIERRAKSIIQINDNGLKHFIMGDGQAFFISNKKEKVNLHERASCKHLMHFIDQFDEDLGVTKVKIEIGK